MFQVLFIFLYSVKEIILYLSGCSSWLICFLHTGNIKLFWLRHLLGSGLIPASNNNSTDYLHVLLTPSIYLLFSLSLDLRCSNLSILLPIYHSSSQGCWVVSMFKVLWRNMMMNTQTHFLNCNLSLKNFTFTEYSLCFGHTTMLTHTLSSPLVPLRCHAPRHSCSSQFLTSAFKLFPAMLLSLACSDCWSLIVGRLLTVGGFRI